MFSLAGNKAGYEAYKSMMSSGMALEGSQAEVATLCAAPSALSMWLSLNYSIRHIGALSARDLVQRGLKSRETSSPKRPQE